MVLGFVGLLVMLGPHLLDPFLAEGLEIVLGDEVLMLDVGLREAAPEEVRDFVLRQLAVFIGVGRGKEAIDRRLAVPDAYHVTAKLVRTRHRHTVPMSPVERRTEASMASEPVMPAPSAERELVSAPTVPAEAAVEAVSGMMCKGVAAETVSAESAASMLVAAMVSPSEPAPLTSFVVTPSAMSKFAGKPAAAVMVMPAVKSAVPGPAKFRMSAVMPVSMTFVTRPAVMMVVVTVIASPGKSIPMTAPLTALASVSLTLAALASVSLTLAALVSMLGPFFPVTIAPVSIAAITVAAATGATVTIATLTAARLFVPHAAFGVVSASATLGVLARSSFTMFSVAPCSLIPLGKLTHPAFAATTASRPGSLVVIVAIRIAVATSGIISPRSAGPFASSVIAVCVSIVATIVSHLVRTLRSPANLANPSGSRTAPMWLSRFHQKTRTRLVAFSDCPSPLSHPTFISRGLGHFSRATLTEREAAQGFLTSKQRYRPSLKGSCIFWTPGQRTGLFF